MSAELSPTKENVLFTLEENLLGRNAELLRFLELLNGINEAMSISLNGYWGSGKTFFVKQAELSLNYLNPFSNSLTEEERSRISSCFMKIKSDWLNESYKPQIAVYYDAWANDNDVDPVLSIIYSIIKAIDSNYKITEDSGFLKIAGSILDCISGKEITRALESLSGKDPLKIIREQHELTGLLKRFLQDVILERGDRLVVFVDELDRCRPSYAVQLLERIKHYFEIDNVTFVFSINSKELQHTVKRCYGEDFSAGRYLNRFFDVRISLPPVNNQNLYQKMGLENSEWVYDRNCRKVIELFGLELREIHRFWRIANIAAFAPTHVRSRNFLSSNGMGAQYNLLYIVPLLIGLQILDMSQYEAFISGSYCEPLEKLMALYDNCEDILAPFLSPDRTFHYDYDNKVQVEINDIIREWYEAIFANSYGIYKDSHVMGKLTFGKYHRQEILKVVSLLSPFAKYDNA